MSQLHHTVHGMRVRQLSDGLEQMCGAYMYGMHHAGKGPVSYTKIKKGSRA